MMNQNRIVICGKPQNVRNFEGIKDLDCTTCKRGFGFQHVSLKDIQFCSKECLKTGEHFLSKMKEYIPKNPLDKSPEIPQHILCALQVPEIVKMVEIFLYETLSQRGPLEQMGTMRSKLQPNPQTPIPSIPIANKNNFQPPHLNRSQNLSTPQQAPKSGSISMSSDDPYTNPNLAKSTNLSLIFNKPPNPNNIRQPPPQQAPVQVQYRHTNPFAPAIQNLHNRNLKLQDGQLGQLENAKWENLGPNRSKGANNNMSNNQNQSNNNNSNNNFARDLSAKNPQRNPFEDRQPQPAMDHGQRSQFVTINKQTEAGKTDDSNFKKLEDKAGNKINTSTNIQSHIAIAVYSHPEPSLLHNLLKFVDVPLNQPTKCTMVGFKSFTNFYLRTKEMESKVDDLDEEIGKFFFKNLQKKLTNPKVGKLVIVQIADNYFRGEIINMDNYNTSKKVKIVFLDWSGEYVVSINDVYELPTLFKKEICNVHCQWDMALSNKLSQQLKDAFLALNNYDNEDGIFTFRKKITEGQYLVSFNETPSAANFTVDSMVREPDMIPENKIVTKSANSAADKSGRPDVRNSVSVSSPTKIIESQTQKSKINEVDEAFSNLIIQKTEKRQVSQETNNEKNTTLEISSKVEKLDSNSKLKLEDDKFNEVESDIEDTSETSEEILEKKPKIWTFDDLEYSQHLRTGSKVHIVFINSLSDFFVRALDDDEEFDRITGEIENYINESQNNKDSHYPDSHIPKIDEIYICVDPNDGSHCRGRVIKVDPNKKSATLQLIDAGEIVEAKFKNIYKLPKKFMMVPILAMNVCLSGLKKTKTYTIPDPEIVLENFKMEMIKGKKIKLFRENEKCLNDFVVEKC